MKDLLKANDVYLDEIENQNDLLKDQLLEASLTEDIKNLVITSCVEIRNKDLHDEIERISKESKDTYKDLFESVQRSKVEIKQCDEVKVKDDFDEIETRNIELEYHVASLIKENEHLKLTYKNLFDSIKKSRVLKKKQLDISELNMESGENVCDNDTCQFLTKFAELEKILTQQTKDFNDVKLELSNRTAKFEAYFEKLEKTKVVLVRQLHI
ncbi:hypothetical protein Tco_0331555 [Tanacetum coccineum]